MNERKTVWCGLLVIKRSLAFVRKSRDIYLLSVISYPLLKKTMIIAYIYSIFVELTLIVLISLNKIVKWSLYRWLYWTASVRISSRNKNISHLDWVVYDLFYFNAEFFYIFHISYWLSKLNVTRANIAKQTL